MEIIEYRKATWCKFILCFAAFKKGQVNYSIKNYRSSLDTHTFGIWSKKRVNEFNTAEIRDFIQEGLSVYSEAHRKSMLKFLRAVFRFAVEREIIHRDPCPKLIFKKNEKIKKMLKEDEIRLLLKRAKEINHAWFPI